MQKLGLLLEKVLIKLLYNKTTVDNIAFDYGNGLGVGIADAPHGLQNNDLVNISGIGTGEMRFLEGPRTIGGGFNYINYRCSNNTRAAGNFTAENNFGQAGSFTQGTGRYCLFRIN